MGEVLFNTWINLSNELKFTTKSVKDGLILAQLLAKLNPKRVESNLSKRKS
uniref:Uncharacterized protein n=1 Tax=Rhizophora mucronata TaxID=61149 RepID=A0A2P2NHX8_RHIMU